MYTMKNSDREIYNAVTALKKGGIILKIKNEKQLKKTPFLIEFR